MEVAANIDVPGSGWADLLLREEEARRRAAELDAALSGPFARQLLVRDEALAKKSTSASRVERAYSLLLNARLVRAYDRADAGELWRAGASASLKLRALEGAVKDELLRAGVRRSLVAQWSLYNSNIFNRAAVRRAEGRDVADTPVLVTLNCAPVDDGGSGACASSWTPDYVSSIVEALDAFGLWPAGLVPLVVEFRAVCPVLLAASDAGLSALDADHVCGGGWA